MAAGTFVIHDKFKEYMGDGAVDLDADTFKMALFQSTSNVATTSINALATATNEVAGGTGYTAGGVALTSVTWTESGGTVTFDAADMTNAWTASTGSIVARFGVIYDDTVTTPVADPIVAHFLLDSTPADVTTTDGNTLTINFNALGIFTIS